MFDLLSSQKLEAPDPSIRGCIVEYDGNILMYMKQMLVILKKLWRSRMLSNVVNIHKSQMNSEINIVVVTVYGLSDKPTVYSLEERSIKV